MPSSSSSSSKSSSSSSSSNAKVGTTTTSSSTGTPPGDLSAPYNAWIKTFDHLSFTNDVKELGLRLNAEQGPADVQHLNKIILWSNLFCAVGLLTMGFGVNALTVICLSTWTFSRWTMIGHHVCHGGYDRVHPDKTRFNRFKFGLGSVWARVRDWLDWMLPEAWNVEHNNRHHYKLSERDDPDLVEQNLEFVRNLDVPLAVKYLIVLGNAMTWKWFYYAPNTYKELKLAKLRKNGLPIPEGVDPHKAVTVSTLLMDNTKFYSVGELFSKVLGPYLLIHFILLPLPIYFVAHFLPSLGMSPQAMYTSAVLNLVLGELLTNVHSFVMIVTNHAGYDLYRFAHPCEPYSGSFYLRQVLASADYDWGSDHVDFLHGWLNYQVEHHLWPNLSMLSYRKAAPAVRAICRKHGVPLVSESVLIRLKRTVDIMVGNTSMRWFPIEAEERLLREDANIGASKTTLATAGGQFEVYQDKGN